MRILKLFIVILLLQANIAEAQFYESESNVFECHKTRLAFVIEDHVILAQLSNVNQCKNYVISTLKNKKVDVDFLEQIRISKNKKYLPQRVIYQSILSVSQIIDEFKVDCSKIKCRGIISGAIAKNTFDNDTFIQYMQRKNNVKLFNPNTFDMAKIRFNSIFAKKLIPKRKGFIFLDLNDQYYRFVIEKNNDLKLVEFDYSIDIFANQVLKLIKGIKQNEHDLEKYLHPLSNKQIKQAIHLIQQNIEANNINQVKSYLGKRKKIFALGDPVKYVLHNVINSQRNYFNKVDLMNAILRMTNLPGELIKQQFQPSMGKKYQRVIIYLLFIYNIVKQFGLEDIVFINHSSDLDGFLISQKYW